MQKIVALIGPSGVGKSTVASQLQKAGLVYLEKSYTTRPPRFITDSSHNFVTSKIFAELEKAGEFVASVQAFGLPYKYAMKKLPASNLPILFLSRAEFVPLIKKFYPSTKIYQIEAPKKVAENWVLDRGDKNLGSRLEQFDAELLQGRKFADRIFKNNSSLKALVAKISSALKEDF